MGRLAADRYFTDDERHGWDLATGEPLPADSCPEAEPCDDPPLTALVEVLEHGLEGTPRWIAVDDPCRNMARSLRRAALDGQARGFVPVAVDVYLRLRASLDEELQDRTLLLIAVQGTAPEMAWMALVDAAARSPRPHVLLTLRGHAGRALFVREARSLYGTGARPARRAVFIDAEGEQHLLRAQRAAAFVREGRHAAAERLLRDVSAALARRGQFAASARVAIELGQTILERGRAADADRTFAEAAEQASSVSDGGLTADARIWQASARTDAGRLTDAESLCRAVLASGSLAEPLRLRARASLARVLVWQGRVPDAAALDLRVPDGPDLDAVSAAYVDATAIRVLLADERVFDAGVRAQDLLGRVAGGEPKVRLMGVAAYLRVLVSAGDLGPARERLHEALALAKEARTPFRAARVRLIWADGLLRAGRTSEAARELRRLRRLCAPAPVLLRRAVMQSLRACESRSAAVLVTPPRSRGDAAAAVRLVALAHEEEHDVEAVRRVLTFVAEATRASRIDVCSVDAGPVSTIVSVGAGLSTALGARVLEAGLAIGPETTEGGHEQGVPVRRGLRLVAAIVARWPADRAPAPDALELLELAAAVTCPRLEAMASAARVASAAVTAVPELVGTSAAIADVRLAIARAAAAPFAVMIQGESGVGKELVARAIHQLSPRRERRFCDVNCAALPEELLESELFGHTRGAFTGAVTDRPGLFEDADGGTVFLDELLELSPRAQAKLLRVLQQQEVRRVGETFSRKVDVRLVTAANRDASVEAEAGRFRQDLLYRIDVIRIRIPPLRDRPGDVALLAQHFWQSAAARVGTAAILTHGVLAALSRYHWPGNVRELQNVMAALAVAAPSRGSVRAQLLPSAITGAAAVTSTRLADARGQFERRAIESALARAGGNRSRAARELGLSRQGLLKMMRRIGVGGT